MRPSEPTINFSGTKDDARAAKKILKDGKKNDSLPLAIDAISSREEKLTSRLSKPKISTMKRKSTKTELQELKNLKNSHIHNLQLDYKLPSEKKQSEQLTADYKRMKFIANINNEDQIDHSSKEVLEEERNDTKELEKYIKTTLSALEKGIRNSELVEEGQEKRVARELLFICTQDSLNDINIELSNLTPRGKQALVVNILDWKTEIHVGPHGISATMIGSAPMTQGKKKGTVHFSFKFEFDEQTQSFKPSKRELIASGIDFSMIHRH